MNKKVFEHNGRKYFVIKPRGEDERDSKKYFNKGFKQALESGALLRVALDKYINDQKIWDEEKQKEFEKLQTTIIEGLKTLKRGRITLAKGRQTAIEVNDARNALQRLLSTRNEMDSLTAESQGDNERFNYLVSVCVYDDKTGDRVYSSYDDYMMKSTDEFAILAATHFAAHYYGFDENADKNLPEIQFLLKYKFVNDKLEFVDKDGKACDKWGNPVLESVEKNSGEEESGPFLDEDGKEVVVDVPPPTVEPAAKVDEVPDDVEA